MSYASALWKYMTPIYPWPSPHEVITGFFIPNDDDEMFRADNFFGTTIKLMDTDSTTGESPDCDDD